MLEIIFQLVRGARWGDESRKECEWRYELRHLVPCKVSFDHLEPRVPVNGNTPAKNKREERWN